MGGFRGFTEEEKGLAILLLFIPDVTMVVEEMFVLYFQRDAVEKVFERMKRELSLGLNRYQRPDRQGAHSTMVHVPYVLWSWAERKLKEGCPSVASSVRKKYPAMSLTERVHHLEAVSRVRFCSKKSIRGRTTRLTEVQEAILNPLEAAKFLPVS